MIWTLDILTTKAIGLSPPIGSAGLAIVVKHSAHLPANIFLRWIFAYVVRF